MAQTNFGNVLICGLGRSTSSVAQFLMTHLDSNPNKVNDGVRVQSLTVYGGKANDASLQTAHKLRDAGATVIFDTEDVQGNYDLAVMSPGISVHSDFYKAAVSAAEGQTICEPELAYRLQPQRWVGITGTNGKTTTTTLTAALIAASGVQAVPCGNIGLPCIDAVAQRVDGDYMVAELSSYQLTSMNTFAPVAAILLNITPDHIEWHGTLEHYAESKMRIFANQTPEQFAIVDCTCAVTRTRAAKLVQQGHSLIAVGGPQGFSECYHPLNDIAADAKVTHLGSAYLLNGKLCVEIDGQKHILAHANQLQIKGEHNVQNALCAAAAAVVCDIADEYIIQGLLGYSPMEHRVEPCGMLGATRFYNDSKATNTDASAKALTAFADDDVIILLGGHDKGTDLTDLVNECLASCKAVVCFGEAKQRFADAFYAAENKKGCQILEATNLEAALDAALDASSDGDVILLSPACSSFDEFKSFEQRGEVFKQMVATRIAQA